MSDETAMERQAREKAAKLGIELLPLKDSFAEMRKRMIDGWAMCQLTCPISGFPLVKKENVLWSIRCKCPIKDPNNSMGGIEPEKVETPMKAEATAQKNSSSSSGKKKSFLGTPGRRERMNVQSKRISEKLLIGWKMLKAVCPITNECPLLEDKTGRQWSAALNMYVDEYKDAEESQPNEETPPTLNNTTQQSSQLLPSSSITARGNVVVDEPAPEHDFSDEWKPPTVEEEREMAAKQKGHDEMSKKMGQMLLTGWKMLDEICPVTGEVPLMQHKDGRKFSVALNACIGEEESDRNFEEKSGDAIEEVAPTATLKTISTESRPSLSAIETNQNNKSSAKTSVDTDLAHDDFVEISSNTLAINVALRAVNKKLLALSDNLEQATNASDVKHTLENIIACTNAIKGLKDIETV